MSKNDNLLTEAQVRQFMKLANLTPLTPGFVHGLTEKAAFKKGQETEAGGPADESPTKGQDLTHSGKGRGEKKGDEAYVNEAFPEDAAELSPEVKGALQASRPELKGVSTKPRGVAGSGGLRKGGGGEGAATIPDLPPAPAPEGSSPALKGPRRPDVQAQLGKLPKPKLPQQQQESHGRGRGEGAAGYGHPDDERPGARLREGELEDEELDDLEDAADLERADDLDLDAEEDLEDAGLDLEEPSGGREISVDDFLAALEIALEDVLGDEVEVDQEEEEEVELPLDSGEELDVDVEEEEELDLPLQEMINKITKRVAKRIVREALRNKK